MEWRQFATKIQMNDEKSSERQSVRGFGMGVSIPAALVSAFGLASPFYAFLFFHVLPIHCIGENPASRKKF